MAVNDIIFGVKELFEIMRRNRLASLCLAVCAALLLSACSAPEPLKTDIGSFEYKQTFMTQIGDTVPSEGNTLLVIYLTPVEGSDVDLDVAKDYFYNGTKVKLAGETYDFKCLAYEKVDESYIRFGLVFEVKDNGYADATEQPVVELMLPPLPEATPSAAPTASKAAATAVPTDTVTPAVTDEISVTPADDDAD